MNKEEYLWLSQLNVTNNQNKPQDLTCHSTLSVWQRKNKATEIELKVRNDILKYRAQCSEKYEEIQSSSFSFPWIHQQLTGLSAGFSPNLPHEGCRTRGRCFHTSFMKPASQHKPFPIVCSTDGPNNPRKKAMDTTLIILVILRYCQYMKVLLTSLTNEIKTLLVF